MSKSSALTVVIPRLFEQLQFQHAQAAASSESLLARIAGRGDVAHRWAAHSPEQARLAPWQYGLLAALSLPPADYPSAPTCALGRHDTNHADATRAQNMHWIHADPIHLVAGLNDVTLIPLQAAFDLTPTEQEAMHDTLAAHLRDEDLSLEPSPSGAWSIGAAANFEVETVHPQFAASHEWDVVLPKGVGAARVRRLITEIQMLLHEHAANEMRAARGAPAVNALWLWGAGQVRASATPVPATCIGRHEYLRGVCRANDWPEPIEAGSVHEMLQASTGPSSVALLDAIPPAEFETEWLTPLLDALKAHRIDRLELVLDEWLVTIDRWRWRRIWRSASHFTQWASA